MRIHLFEFEDQNWFPDLIRSGGTDYLRYFLIKTELYKPTVPLILKILKATNTNRIIDLCSGGGGYIEHIYNELDKLAPHQLQIILTDKFPNIPAYRMISERTKGGIDYYNKPVDVFNVPKDLKGLRVLFSAIHHFKPEQVTQILGNAVKDNAPIAIFDGGEKGIHIILGLILVHPIAFILCTPFFKPFKWSRLLLTYVIPLIPLYTIWDGIVSILRMYKPEHLLEMARAIDSENYFWKSGSTRNRFGIKASYLIGYPRNEN